MKLDFENEPVVLRGSISTPGQEDRHKQIGKQLGCHRITEQNGHALFSDGIQVSIGADVDPALVDDRG